MPKQAWIGLAQVEADGDGPVLSSGEGAYVHAIGLAADAEEFLDSVRAALVERDLVLTSFEDPETLLDRRHFGRIDDELLRLAESLDTQTPVVFGTFESFDTED